MRVKADKTVRAIISNLRNPRFRQNRPLREAQVPDGRTRERSDSRGCPGQRSGILPIRVPHICTPILPQSQISQFRQHPLDKHIHLYYHQLCTHFWSQIDGSGQLSSQHLARGTRTNTLTASTDNIKVTESIGDRVGGYNFLPALISSRSRRKQCPLHLVNSESSLLGCAGSEGCMTGWSPRTLQARHHKPIDSTGVETGQPSFRGRVRCQSLFIAGERRRCEPGSNSVIVTASLTRCEGHVLRLGGVRRTRKIFAGCPAIRPIWDQSPALSMRGFETVGNRLHPLHGQIRLCCSAAEAQIQDRSRSKTGLNTAPAFPRVYNQTSPSRSEGDAGSEATRRGCPTRHRAKPTTSSTCSLTRPILRVPIPVHELLDVDSLAAQLIRGVRRQNRRQRVQG